MKIVALFISFFKIGLFSFGGGYAMLPLIQQEVVEKHQWISTGEFLDIIAVSQATPGPVAVNTATYVGFIRGGILGSTAATLGVIMPSVIIIYILAKLFYIFKDNEIVERAFKGIRIAVVGLIAAAAIMVANGAFIDYKSIILFVIAFIAQWKYKADPILMIVVAGIIGLFIY